MPGPQKNWHHCGNSGDILDIGCGRGDFLNFMRERGWRVQGIEIHPGLVDICESRGITCQIGELGTLSFPENFFDAITFRDVLEHIPTPPASSFPHGSMVKAGWSYVYQGPQSGLDQRTSGKTI